MQFFKLFAVYLLSFSAESFVFRFVIQNIYILKYTEL